MKRKNFVHIFVAMVMSIGFFVCPTAKEVALAKETRLSQNNEAELNLAVMNRWGTSGDNIFDSITHVDSGLEMQVALPVNTVRSACSSQIFNVKDEDDFSIRLTIPKFGTVDGETTYKADYLEVYLRSEYDANLKTWIRIYTNQADATAYTAECRIKTPTVERSTQFRVLPEVNGENVSFDLNFDTTNNFSGYFVSRKNWTPTEWSSSLNKTSLYDITPDNQNLSATNIALSEYQTLFEEIFSTTECMQLVVKIGTTSSATGVYTSKMIINEVAGQSLAKSDKGFGYVNDTVPPYLSDLKLAMDDVKGYTQYSFEVLNKQGTGSANLSEPDNETTFYSDYANDFISFATDLNYKINLTYPDGSKETFDGVSFMLKDAGEYKISVTVSDNVGNSYTTDEFAFTAKDFFRIVFENEHFANATVGEGKNLPVCYAQNELGERSDTDGKPFPVKIKVLNPYGIDVTASELKDGVFTPTKTGTYTIRYSAVSLGGESYSKSFDVQVTEKSGCGSVTGLGSGVVALASALMITLRKKRNDRKLG